jgi:hypothetical protein
VRQPLSIQRIARITSSTWLEILTRLLDRSDEFLLVHLASPLDAHFLGLLVKRSFGSLREPAFLATSRIRHSVSAGLGNTGGNCLSSALAMLALFVVSDLLPDKRPRCRFGRFPPPQLSLGFSFRSFVSFLGMIVASSLLLF